MICCTRFESVCFSLLFHVFFSIDFFCYTYTFSGCCCFKYNLLRISKINSIFKNVDVYYLLSFVCVCVCILFFGCWFSLSIFKFHFVWQWVGMWLLLCVCCFSLLHRIQIPIAHSSIWWQTLSKRHIHSDNFQIFSILLLTWLNLFSLPFIHSFILIH